MTLVFSSTDFKYELESVVKLFLPAQLFKIVIAPSENGIDDDICFVKSEKGAVFTSLYVFCRIGDKITQEAGIILNSTPNYESECEMALARYLYKCLQELTGKQAEWGIITGIRPVKQINSMVSHGLSEKEIRKNLAEKFLCSEKKIDTAFAVAQAQKRALKTLRRNSFSLYISIPFCPSRCSYCSFVSQSVESCLNLIPEYVTNLCAEIRYTANIMSKLGIKLDTIYFGGGTPTSLEASYLTAIMKTIDESFDTSAVREYTVEAGRPDTITADKLTAILKGGASRISINPQTLNDDVLREIGRKHTVTDFYEKYVLARSMGFDYINTDLIAGLPTDTIESFRDTIDGMISLSPENITVHTLSIKRAADLNQRSRTVIDNTTAEMIDYASTKLSENEYVPYYLYRQKNMLDNLENIGWAKRGYESFYNIYIMEENQTIIAVGAGGSTKLVNGLTGDIKRVFNHKFPLEYNKHFDLMLERKQEIEEFFLGEKK